MSQRHFTPASLSLEAWCALPEERAGELVRGVLVEEEMPDAAHETVVLFLATLFEAWLEGRGYVLLSGVKYALSADLGRKPDLSVFLPGSPRPPRRGPVRAAPDIVVEVVSSSATDRRRDRIQKLREYAQFGVRYYWLVDPEARTVEILERMSDGTYRHALDAESGTFDVPGCSALVLDLDALWAKVDRLDFE